MAVRSCKRLKYIPFKKLILENAGLPMDKQLSMLDLRLKEWQGDHEQIDDICLIGVRF